MKQFTLTLGIAAAALFSIHPNILAEDKPAGEAPKRPEGGRPGGPGGERRDPEARLKFMTEKLGLDADQQAKIKAINEKNAPKMKELFSKGRDNLTDADKAAMRELFKTQNDEINAVLKPDQQEKLKALRAQGRPGEGRPGGERKPGDRKPGERKPDAPKPEAAK